MKNFWKLPSFMILLLIVSVILNKDIIFSKKILFPSNFLVSFYSPWSTEKIKGWEHGVPHKPIGDDQIRIFYPERFFSNEMLAKRSIPLWDPYVFSGTPHLANFQTSIFYPLNIIYLFSPQITAWSFLLIIQPIMASTFMFLFLSLFSLKKPAVWLGSIAFGLSGFIIVWSQENMVVGQAALWLPLALFGLEGFLKTKRLKYYLISVLALAFSFLAGFFQVTFYIYALTLIYSIFRIRNLKSSSKIKEIGLILSIYLLSLSLSSAQLLPSIEAFMNSPRSTSSAWYLFEGYLLPITHIFNVLAPDIFGNPGNYNFFGRGFYRETILYIGIVPIIFSLYVIFRAKKDFLVIFFAGSVLISFFLAIDSPLTKFFFQLPLPLLPAFLPSRIFLITAFSLAVLSAIGFSKWLNEKEKKHENIINRSFLAVFFVFVFIASYALLLFLTTEKNQNFSLLNDYIIRKFSIIKKQDVIVMIKNLILPFFMLLLSVLLIRLKRYSSSLSALGIILLVFFGQVYFFNKYKIHGEPEFLFPKNEVISFLQEKDSIERFVSFGRPIHENSSIYNHLYSIEGVNPVFPNRYGQLLFSASNNGKLTNNIPRVEARLSEIGENHQLSRDYRRLRLLSLLNVNYVLYFEENSSNEKVSKRFSSELFNHVWQKGNWHAFEYKKVLPRVFLGNPYIEKNSQKTIDLIFDPKFDLSKNIILEEKPLEINQANEVSSQDSNDLAFAKIINYEPSRVKILAKTDQPKVLFISDNYYPGWKAFVDNNPTKIYRANYTFRAIYLPEGEHEVTFLYQPGSFRIGSYISLFSLLLLSSILILKRTKFL